MIKFTWADEIKVLDASGRHNWGLLSGSKYWIGASDQCRQLDNDFIDLMKKNRSHNARLDIPPYRVSVNSVRLVLDIFQPGINGVGSLYLGMRKKNGLLEKVLFIEIVLQF